MFSLCASQPHRPSYTAKTIIILSHSLSWDCLHYIYRDKTCGSITNLTLICMTPKPSPLSIIAFTLVLSCSFFSHTVPLQTHTDTQISVLLHPHTQKQAKARLSSFKFLTEECLDLIIVWMDPSSGQHQQMSSQSLENMLASSKSQQERKPRPQPEQALKCPRCDSSNTKFCYYNNYSLSQPRYFCKSCRRYWTKGGTLRNVPVGGGCRKAKRSSSSKRAQDQTFKPNSNPIASLPHLSYDSSDLTVALVRLQKQSCGQLGFDEHDLSILGNPTSSLCDILGNPGMNHSTTNHGFLDAFRSGFLGTQNNNLQNMYCVYGNGDTGEVDNGNSCGVGVSGEMMLPYDHEMRNAATQEVTVTTMKQEPCSGREQSESRVLGGFPWQLNGDTNMGELDSGRASWNGFTSSCHGLLHSPLM